METHSRYHTHERVQAHFMFVRACESRHISYSFVSPRSNETHSRYHTHERVRAHFVTHTYMSYMSPIPATRAHTNESRHLVSHTQMKYISPIPSTHFTSHTWMIYTSPILSKKARSPAFGKWGGKWGGKPHSHHAKKKEKKTHTPRQCHQQRLGHPPCLRTSIPAPTCTRVNTSAFVCQFGCVVMLHTLHIYIYTYVYTCVHIYVYIYMYEYMNICLYIYTYMHSPTCIHMHTNAYTRAHTRALTRARTHTLSHTPKDTNEEK